eukprot:9498845-Pyramimonas_sp.AAC.1
MVCIYMWTLLDQEFGDGALERLRGAIHGGPGDSDIVVIHLSHFPEDGLFEEGIKPVRGYVFVILEGSLEAHLHRVKLLRPNGCPKHRCPAQYLYRSALEGKPQILQVEHAFGRKGVTRSTGQKLVRLPLAPQQGRGRRVKLPNMGDDRQRIRVIPLDGLDETKA